MTQGNPRNKNSLFTAEVGPLLRGHIEQYTSVDTILEDASLPAEATDYIRKVIRQAKLRRSERLDAARALVEQFNPQMNGGTAVVLTIHSLGPSSVYAKSLHQAFFQKRSWPRRAWHHTRRIVGRLLLMASLVWLACGLFVFSRHPTINHDYLAQINAEVDIFPEDQRAWPIYEKAAAQIDQLPRMLPEDFWLVEEIEPETPEWNHLTDWLNTNQTLLEQIREATLLPTAGVRYKPEQITMIYSNPRREEKISSLHMLDRLHLNTFAALRDVLTADAYVAIHERDEERALANWHALIRMSSHLRRGPTIDQLMALGIRGFALKSILHSLHTAPDLLSDAELLKLQQTIVAQGNMPTFDFEVDRLVLLNFLQHVYSDDGNGNGYITMEFVPVAEDRRSDNNQNLLGALTNGPMLLAISPTRQKMRGYIDSFFDHETTALASPYWDYQPWNHSQISWRYKWARLLIHTSERLRSIAEYARGAIDSATIGIALERYYRNTGTYPDSLAQLTPQFLAEMPVDRYTGDPLRYKMLNGHPLVYSVGRNHLDDGGIPPSKSNPRGLPAPYNPTATGDWILYPELSSQY